MTSLFSIFTDVMLWGSVPLFGGLGYWEEHLVLSQTNRILMQILLLAVVMAWAGFWYSTGENYRLTHRPISKPKYPQVTTPIEDLHFGVDESSLKENKAEPWKFNEEVIDNKKARNYVSNH